MKKPTRTQVKNTAITIGVLGGALATMTYGNHLVSTYYKMKIDRTEMLMVLDKIAIQHPEVLREALDSAYAELADHYAASLIP